MTAQSLDEGLDERQLLAVVAERVGTVKEAVSELKEDMKQDGLAIRAEMRTGFKDLEVRLERHEQRLTSLETDRAKAQGSVGFGKWFLGALGPLGSVIGFLAGKSQ